MRISSLDGVRALLALWVVFGHLSRMIGVPVPLLGNPAVAVDVFMVLSGFFIAMTFEHLLQERPAATATRCFLIRRAMRIWPLYAVMLAFSWMCLEPQSAAKVLAAQTFPFPSAEESLYAQQPFVPPDWRGWLLHYSMLHGLVASQATSTPLPDWSLSLEFQFYLLFPLLAWVLHRRPLLLCFVAAGLAFVSPGLLGDYLLPGRFAHFHQPAALVYKLNFFLLGVMLWRLFGRVRHTSPPQLELLAVVLCLVPMGAQEALACFGLLYLLARPEGRAARLLSHPVMAWLGRISFTIYLVHMPLMRWVVAALIEQAGLASLAPPARLALALLCVVPPVLAASQLLHRLVELPGIRLAHRWTRTRAAGKGAAVASSLLT